ncbi:ATP-binding protein [Seleniivibrio sp.]|uniref:ATP-binding protein n=1 Tax=Seleniivibrio sp. TaxID=2898801 RepID=UPI0025EC9306|nr:ATP-binding protein [Seleniivibrio sp.]MCD8553208.1 ATP-binding protein [Seleniivibrio sp.]
MSVQKRTFVFITAIIVLICTIYTGLLEYEGARQAAKAAEEKKEVISGLYNDFPIRIDKLLSQKTRELASDRDVVSALKRKDRTALSAAAYNLYDRMADEFNREKIIMNFITPDGTVLLRMSAPKKYGDILKGSRVLLDRAAETGFGQSGTEEGLSGVFIRNILPIYSEGICIGYAETGVIIDFLVKRISSTMKMDGAVIIFSRFADMISGITDYTRFSDRYMLFSTDDVLFRSILSSFYESEGKDVHESYQNRKYHIISGIDIPDVTGTVIGELVFLSDETGQYHKMMRHIVISALIGVFIIVISILVMKRNFIDLIGDLEYRHNKIEQQLKDYSRNLENQMDTALEKLAESEQTIQNRKKMSDIERITDAMSQKIAKPLSYMKNSIQKMENSETAKEQLALIAEMEQYLDEVNSYFRKYDGKEVFDVSEEIQALLYIMRSHLKQNDIKVYLTEKEAVSMEVFGYRGEFKQALMNIITNSVDALKVKHPDSVDFEAAVRINVEVDGGNVRVAVTDNGGGIDNIARIFDSGYTTKGSGYSGLGLFITKNIIEKHMNGRIYAHNTDDGASFIILVPVFQS